MVRLGSLPVSAAVLAAALFAPCADTVVTPETGEHHHKHHHKHHHHKHHHKDNHGHGHHGHRHQHDSKEAKQAEKVDGPSESAIMGRLHALEHTLDAASANATTPAKAVRGKLEVNGPLPMDFSERFASAAAAATGGDASQVQVMGAVPVSGQHGKLDEVSFEATKQIADSLLAQASDPSSKLANGPLHSFLVARDDDDEGHDEAKHEEQENAAEPAGGDFNMPFGDLEPFGREDTAKDLTDASIRESDEMVDQLERAEGAEERRAVFRALTRLRGAAITSFDGIARAHTGNLDEYSRNHHWRAAHPVRHLASEEADVAKWAFPDGHDF